MADDKVLHTMRNMAWERAKGELESMLHTFWPGLNDDGGKFEKLSSKIEQFVKEVEDNGLQE